MSSDWLTLSCPWSHGARAWLSPRPNDGQDQRVEEADRDGSHAAFDVPCGGRRLRRPDGRGHTGRRERQGHRSQHGGAGLAADPHHAGPRQREVQGEVRQQRDAQGRLHPVAGLLRAAGRLADLGREEVPDGGVRQPVAGRLRRGRLLSADQQVHQRRSRVAGDLQGSAPERGLGLLDLSLQVARSTTASRRCRTCWSSIIARTSSATRPSRRTTWPSTARSCPAPARRWTTSTGIR